MEKRSVKLRKELSGKSLIAWMLSGVFLLASLVFFWGFCKQYWEPVLIPAKVKLQWLQQGILMLMASGAVAEVALIFREICRTGIPFSISVTHRFRVIAGILVLTGLLLAASAWIVSGRYIHDMNPPLISIMGVFVLAISEIFRYGCSLQQEMDQIA